MQKDSEDPLISHTPHSLTCKASERRRVSLTHWRTVCVSSVGDYYIHVARGGKVYPM